MSKDTPKTIDGLMRHLRNKGINISGSLQKRNLMNMGYYHGYKGYRYIKSATNRIKFTDFNEVIALYKFDCSLKTLFYSYIMQIETALKNYVIEVIVQESNSDNFTTIYNNLLTDYKRFTKQDQINKAIKNRMQTRDNFYNAQTRGYNKNNIVTHFVLKNTYMPIWAIFELITLGEFGNFVAALNLPCRQHISQKIGIPKAQDTSADLPRIIIFTIKDLRNSVAHNNIIFDVRFKTSSINTSLINAISCTTSIKNINFETIIDYLILVIYLLKYFKFRKNDMKNIVRNFEEISDELKKNIPLPIFNKILTTDYKNKITQLKNFISQ